MSRDHGQQLRVAAAADVLRDPAEHDASFGGIVRRFGAAEVNQHVLVAPLLLGILEGQKKTVSEAH